MSDHYQTNLFAWHGPSDWKASLGNAFVKSGYSWSGDRVWRSEETFPGPGTLFFCTGWKIKRMGWSREEPGLLLEPSRFAFDGSSETPLSRPNLEGVEPFDGTPFLRELDTLPAKLQENGGACFTLEQVHADLKGATAGGLARVDGTGRASAVFSQSLGRFRRSMEPQRLLLIATGHEPTQHREMIIRRARNLSRVFSHGGNEVILRFSLPSEDDVARIAGDPKHKGFNPVLLHFLPGIHGDLPPAEATELLDRVSRRGIPFQIISYQNDSNFADRSMVVAVHHKTGRPPYCVRGSRILDVDPTLLIGVDQAHPRGKHHSYLSVVALSSQGELLARQHLRAPRDETLDAKALSEALKNLKATLGDKLPQGRPVIVMRDGKRFPREDWRTWEHLSPLPSLTFLEVKKHPFPAIFRGSLEPPEPGSVFSIPGSDELFLYPIRAGRGQVGHSLRIRPSHNPKDYDPLALGEMLTACCHMAGLGLHPSTRPSPIYWADGFAGLSQIQLKFSGFSRLASNTSSPGVGSE